MIENDPVNNQPLPINGILSREEYEDLVASYGNPIHRTYRLQADDYLFRSRSYRSQTRRGEVVLAIDRPKGCLLVHRKSWYESGVYRLLSGGIDQDESVENALWRELKEETGLTTGEADFIGVLDCRIIHDAAEVEFPSFVFFLSAFNQEPVLPENGEDISQFRDLPIVKLPDLAKDLKSVPGERHGWGQWRAIAHDFVFEVLSSREG